MGKYNLLTHARWLDFLQELKWFTVAIKRYIWFIFTIPYLRHQQINYKLWNPNTTMWKKSFPLNMKFLDRVTDFQLSKQNWKSILKTFAKTFAPD